MNLNIFKVPRCELAALRQTLKDKGFTLIRTQAESSWHTEFFFLEGEEEVASWVQIYEEFFAGQELPTRKNHSAVYLFQRSESCYTITHGSSHFHVRPFCDCDFGIDLAKRIADQADIKQTAAKRYQGNKRKEHRTYRANTRLDVDSGESIDLIQAAIISSKREAFGSSGKFGTSAILSPSIGIDDIAEFLSTIDAELENPERFKLPRDTVITDKAQIKCFDQLLIDEITAEDGSTTFTATSLDLCGVDFTFGCNGRYTLNHPRRRNMMRFLDRGGHDLTIDDLRLFIKSESLTGNEILRINVTSYDDNGDWVDRDLKETLDYIAEPHRVVLSEGKWRTFNQHYLAFLDEYVRGIEMEETEEEFKLVSEAETTFNASDKIKRAGYENADRDFSIATIESRTSVEAWDLRKGNTVYALKFGTAQKLGYVCDQAAALIKLLSSRAIIKDIPKFDRYCLWLGYKAKGLPANIADTNSVILKQKIEAWARLCRQEGVTPVIKLSRDTRRKSVLI